ncbi:MAG TPA: class I SAM-dependent methyltransferase [Thermoanaerobaculia bacterium]|nr:class I SAM-dependent methyltransferase [Thermoanaerobaculia bacterium]
MYRRCAAPFGLRVLNDMLANGLPALLGPPLRFLFTQEPPGEAIGIAARIEEMRAEISRRPDTYRFEYSPTTLGMVRWPDHAGHGAAGPMIPAHRLANVFSVPRHWGLFLHLCADAIAARAILEVGACLGISGAYLASAGQRARFITIEGSPALAPIAEATLAAVTDRAEVIRAPFDTGLDEALARFAREQLPIDIAFIDGHHEEAATLHYVETVIPQLSRKAVVILDDIHLTPGMARAWQRLTRTPGIAAAVDVGRFGLIVWHGDDAAGVRYDLSRYTGWWRARSQHRPAG